MAESTPLRDDELQLVLKLLVHDLNNPLAAVVTNLGFAKKLVGESEEGGELQDRLRRLRRTTRRLGRAGGRDGASRGKRAERREH